MNVYPDDLDITLWGVIRRNLERVATVMVICMAGLETLPVRGKEAIMGTQMRDKISRRVQREQTP